MNKYITASLIGYASSATPGAIPTTTWPKFASPTAPSTSSSTANAAGNVLSAYSTANSVSIGPARGFRNNLVVFPTQSVVKAGTAATTDKASIQTQGGTTMTFWQHSLASLGAFFDPVNPTDNTTVGTSSANAAGWVVCSDASAYSKCNGGAGANFKAATSTSHVIPYRLAMQVNVSGTVLQVGGGTTVATEWNQEIVMASFFHAAWAGQTAATDGSKWCSPFKVSLAVDGTETTTSAAFGLGGKTKCTWQFTPADGTKAPGFRLTQTDFVSFVFSYVEWISVAGLGTNAVLPATDGANYYIGAYDSTKGVFLNPMTGGITADTTWSNSGLTWAINDKDPSTRPAGSIGDAIYFTSKDGPFKETGTITVDSAVLLGEQQKKKKEFDDFNNKEKEFTKKKETYEKEATKQEEIEKDVFKTIFEAKVEVPSKPETPSLPPAYSGIELKLGQAITKTGQTAKPWEAKNTNFKNVAYLKNTCGTNGNAPCEKFATKTGFLVSTSDNSKTSDTDIKNIGKAFGKLGQGDASMPKSGSFYWGENKSADTPTIMVSVFPNADADTGLVSTKTLTIKSKAGKWMDLKDTESPKQPPAAKRPKDFKLADASFLAIGAASALGVFSVLY